MAKTKVYIIEYERSYGHKVDDILEFDTKELASDYVREYNKKYNNHTDVPDWYMIASLTP